jgi:hypothetical protein
MASAIPNSLDAMLRRDRTAEALTEAGYPTTPKTLATKATRGGGPPFQRYGRIPLYRWGNSLAWAAAKLGPIVHSTAEAEVLARDGNEPQVAFPRDIFPRDWQRHRHRPVQPRSQRQARAASPPPVSGRAGDSDPKPSE